MTCNLLQNMLLWVKMFRGYSMKKTGMDGAVQQGAVQAQEGSGLKKAAGVLSKVNSIINLICVWAYRLRKFVLAAPVVYVALRLAAYNSTHLPEQVGIDLQTTGEFARTISREFAVMGPLGLTLGCLLMMFFARKASYAWAISVFTLTLPLLLLFSNAYPA